MAQNDQAKTTAQALEYFDPQAEGNHWFEGKKAGWLVISRRNWTKIQAGQTAVIRAGGRELLGKILHVDGTTGGTVLYEATNGARFTEQKYNVLALKLDDLEAAARELAQDKDRADAILMHGEDQAP